MYQCIILTKAMLTFLILLTFVSSLGEKYYLKVLIFYPLFFFTSHWAYYSEKAMATHSSTRAWKIPRAEEPGRLQSMGSLSQTWLSDFTFTFHFRALEEEMATHSSVLAWRIPGTGEPGGLPVYGVAQSRTRLKRLSSSSSSSSRAYYGFEIYQ